MAAQVGVFLVGVNGNVGTCVTAGAAAIGRGLVGEYGLVTLTDDFRDVDLISLEALRFFGWDIRETSHAACCAASGLVPERILAEITSDLNEVQVLRGWRPRNHGECGENESRLDAARRFIREIDHACVSHGLAGAVVVNVSSTESRPPASPIYESLESFETALENDSPAITSGMLYAYAALKAGAHHVNFTPNPTAEIPALLELAKQRRLLIAGNDGKTGQTLYKSVIGHLLRLRNLRITGWYSTNLLGNNDGLTLSDPNACSTKTDSKRKELAEILGYSDFDHQVHVHYYQPRGDAKEAWDNIDFLGWLGTSMSMKINWLGQDSVLAAPLIVDLVRLVWASHLRGASGVATHLAPFFKSPLGDAPSGFFRQTQLLTAFFRTV